MTSRVTASYLHENVHINVTDRSNYDFVLMEFSSLERLEM